MNDEKKNTNLRPKATKHAMNDKKNTNTKNFGTKPTTKNYQRTPFMTRLLKGF